MDHRGLAVHDPVGPHDLGAEGVADALVAEADAEDRDRRGEPLDHGVRDAGFSRRAGAGGDDDPGRIPVGDRVGCDPVVPDDEDVQRGVDLAEALDRGYR